MFFFSPLRVAFWQQVRLWGQHGGRRPRSLSLTKGFQTTKIMFTRGAIWTLPHSSSEYGNTGLKYIFNAYYSLTPSLTIQAFKCAWGRQLRAPESFLGRAGKALLVCLGNIMMQNNDLLGGNLPELLTRWLKEGDKHRLKAEVRTLSVFWI